MFTGNLNDVFQFMDWNKKTPNDCAVIGRLQWIERKPYTHTARLRAMNRRHYNYVQLFATKIIFAQKIMLTCIGSSIDLVLILKFGLFLSLSFFCFSTLNVCMVQKLSQTCDSQVENELQWKTFMLDSSVHRVANYLALV